jgi:small ligand-binding sensory domain FIST
VPWIGLYTYGEIGPIGGRDYFHNYTAVVLAVY